MNDQRFYALALTLVPGLGISGAHQLIRRCGSPSGVFRLSRAELQRSFQLSPDIQSFIAGGCALRTAEKTMQDTQARKIQLLSLYDHEYPQLLKEIFEPPLLLYCLGNVDVLRRPALALVGSRRCSVYGKQISQKLARELAALGLVIVSGLARGIDSQGHIGALEAGGSTVAVLGNGVDVVYPRENRRLYERIRESGCVVSEFPCGSFPGPQNFPIRNRIISGLCYGTVITEAAEFSGSLITARLTLEQNRELFAVPGNVTSPGSYGPNYLIKQGAKVVVTVQDVIDELPFYVLDFLARNRPLREAGDQPDQVDAAPAAVPPSARQEKILNLLPADRAIHFDGLLQDCGLDQPELNQTLLELEMGGLIRQLPGRQFARKL